MSGPGRPEAGAESESEFGFVEALPGWERWLSKWELEVWPMFERHGFSKGAALIAWHLNQLKNTLDGPPEDEEWRG